MMMFLHGYEAQPAVQGKLRNAAKILFLQARSEIDVAGGSRLTPVGNATVQRESHPGCLRVCVRACVRDKEREMERYAELKGNQHVRSRSVGACTARTSQVCVTQLVQPEQARTWKNSVSNARCI